MKTKISVDFHICNAVSLILKPNRISKNKHNNNLSHKYKKIYRNWNVQNIKIGIIKSGISDQFPLFLISNTTRPHKQR